MAVSKNSGTPKWMVKIMGNPIKIDDLGGKPTIFGNIHMDKYLANVKPTLNFWGIKSLVEKNIEFKQPFISCQSSLFE